MRLLATLVTVILTFCLSYTVFGAEGRDIELPFEFRLVNAQGATVSQGYLSLGWDGCSGDLFAFTGENLREKGSTSLRLDADMQDSSGGGMEFSGRGVPIGYPVHVAFWGGDADFSLLDDEVFETLFCNPCGVSSCPLEQCGGCDDTCFYLYETDLCLPDGVLFARVWLPCGMTFKLTTLGEIGVTFPFIGSVE